MEGFFTPEATEALHPRINHVVHSLLDSFREKGSNGKPVDLVQEFAALVNPHVIFLLFDVPPQEAEQLAKASAAVGGTSGTAGESSHTSLHGYISRLVDERIEHPHPPQDDLISKLVLEQYKTGNLSKDDIDRLAFMLFIAGNAAIASSIYLGVLSLLEHPDQLGALRDDPKLIKQAVEEILRYHTPSALNSRRVAREDVQLGDQVWAYRELFSRCLT